MPFNNNRNSRDDKSGKFKQSKANRNERSFSKKKEYQNGANAEFKDDRKKSDKTSLKYSRDEYQPSDRNMNSKFKGKNSENKLSRKNFFGDTPKQRDFGNKSSFNEGADKDDKRVAGTYSQRGRAFSKEESTQRSDRPQFSNANAKKGKAFNRPRKNKTHDSNFAVERTDNGLIRLNRYVANAGICSRRKADELIEAGVVSVNGAVVTELGTKVDPAKDEIRYNGEKLKRERMVYVLLNKPKDYITTTDDPQDRRTVMHLVDKASNERIYPVGRLDRNTTGLILMTNDGSLAEKLSHPRNNIRKLYQVELTKNLSQGDFNKIQYGLELEDGFVKPDSISYVQGGSKKEIGIQIHSGKNRIVRRIFESLGYEVAKLDRSIYANLTKKDLPRGKWRYLNEAETIQLKHFIK